MTTEGNTTPPEGARPPTDRSARRLLTGVFVLLVVFQLLYLVWMGNNPGKYCDGFSEVHALRAAKAYVTDGFSAHHGLPRCLYQQQEHFPGQGMEIDHVGADGTVTPEFRQGFPSSMAYPDNWVYTHYPPGPDLLCGLMVQLCGMNHIWLLRLLPLGFGLLAAWVFFQSLARAFGPRQAVFIAAACVVLPMFNAYMPGLHYQGYSFALLLLELSLVVRGLWVTGGFQSWYWFAFFMFGFLQGWLSFDQCFVVCLAPVPFWLLRRAEGAEPRASWLVLSVGLLGMGFVLAHALHFLQVAAELGGLHQAYEEFRRTAGERAGRTGAVEMPPFLLRVLGPMDNHFGYFGSLALGGYYYLRGISTWRSLQLGPFMLLALIAALPVVAGRASRAEGVTCGQSGWARRWLRWPGRKSVVTALAAALIVSLLWWFFMPAHVVGNRHITVRHLFVLYFCLLLVLARSFPSGLRAGSQLHPNPRNGAGGSGG